MRLRDAFTRWSWPGALEFQGPGPNAPQALSAGRSRGLGWGFWNLGSLPSTYRQAKRPTACYVSVEQMETTCQLDVMAEPSART